MQLTHRQIEAFRAVMLGGTVTAASKLLRISQPSVSRLIADLELALRFDLFERQPGGRISPTQEAIRLLAEVERSFVSLDRILRHAADIGSFRQSQLTVAGMPALCLDVLPITVHRLLEAYPETNVALHAYSSQEIVEGIINQHYELGLAAPPFDLRGVAGEMLVYCPYVCALPAGHHLADKKVIAPQDLMNEPKIILSSARVRHDREQAFSLFGFDRGARIETPLSIVACRQVELGLGCALIEPFTASFYAGRSVVFKPFEPEISFVFGILSPEGRPRSALQREFLVMLEETIRTLRLPANAKVRFAPFVGQP